MLFGLLTSHKGHFEHNYDRLLLHALNYQRAMTGCMHPMNSQGQRRGRFLDVHEDDDQQIRIQAMSAGRVFSAEAVTGRARCPSV